MYINIDDILIHILTYNYIPIGSTQYEYIFKIY